ncbi:MAG: hypothetical protein RSB83_08120, partial [Brevundimonas sp.]
RPTGQSCGSVFGAGYKTLKNGKDSGQFYSSMTFDVNDNFQLFADVLIWLAAIATLWTGWQYFSAAKKQMQDL